MTHSKRTGPLRPIASTSAPVHANERLTQAQIREKAYLIYESRHGAHGCPEMDWLEAERSLMTNAGTGSKPRK